MVVCRLSPSLILLTLSLGGATQASEHFFVRLSEDNRAFNAGNVLQMKTLYSVIECGVECLKMSNCASYNAEDTVSGKVTCAFLSDIPLLPEADLSTASGKQYYEKTCQVFLKPTIATEYEEENTGFLSDRLYVGGDNGYNVYILYLSPNDDIVNITFEVSVVDKTGGEFQKILGMTQVIITDDLRLNIHLVDNGVMCVRKLNNTSESCFTDPVVSKTSLFETEDVNALLFRPDHLGLYAFGFSRITIVDIPTSGPWTTNTTIDLSSGNRPAGWTKIPQGIVGAAWLTDSSGVTPHKAFLLTRYYYVVYDFDIDVVLKRGHLCPPHMGQSSAGSVNAYTT